jgi:hypothetical protein
MRHTTIIFKPSVSSNPSVPPSLCHLKQDTESYDHLPLTSSYIIFILALFPWLCDGFYDISSTLKHISIFFRPSASLSPSVSNANQTMRSYGDPPLPSPFKFFILTVLVSALSSSSVAYLFPFFPALSPPFSPASLHLVHPPHSTKFSSAIACPPIGHNINNITSHWRQHPSTQHQTPPPQQKTTFHSHDKRSI